MRRYTTHMGKQIERIVNADRVEDLIGGLGETGLGYEKIAYLLLMGEMPDEAKHSEFKSFIGSSRTLPTNFTRDVIMKAPGKDIMNTMTRSLLTLASYDDKKGKTHQDEDAKNSQPEGEDHIPYRRIHSDGSHRSFWHASSRYALLR